MKNYSVYKKRDGQDWKKFSDIYAKNFTEAKKKFAENMTNDNWEKSNDIVWLDKSEGVKETGWYDLNGSILVSFPDKNEGTDYANSEMELFCSEKSINKGFDFWNEDVYSYELRK
ncbi:MAG: hypothetical protein ABIJ17_01480 [Patescibacteria group bacterium]